MRTTPDYWWDFVDNATTVIVESSNDAYPVVARFPVEGRDAESQIARAKQLIEDLKAGRIMMKQALQATSR